MPQPHQGNQVVGLFGAEENQETLSITFAGANIWKVGETEQHQHELQIILHMSKVTTKIKIDTNERRKKELEEFQ